MLDAAFVSFDPELAQLRGDHLVRLVRGRPRRRVDEQLVAVARHGEAIVLELARELARLRAELEAEPIEQPVGVLFLRELDVDAPVVGHG